MYMYIYIYIYTNKATDADRMLWEGDWNGSDPLGTHLELTKSTIRTYWN